MYTVNKCCHLMTTLIDKVVDDHKHAYFVKFHWVYIITSDIINTIVFIATFN